MSATRKQWYKRSDDKDARVLVFIENVRSRADLGGFDHNTSMGLKRWHH